MPKILNKRFDTIPADAVYVGRPSEWGNPYSHLDKTIAEYKVNTREEAIACFERDLLLDIQKDPSILFRLKKQLAGKDLVCWCSPHSCHAEVLMKLAND